MQIYGTAFAHGALELAQAARTLAIWKFSLVIKTEQYLQMDLDGKLETKENN